MLKRRIVCKNTCVFSSASCRRLSFSGRLHPSSGRAQSCRKSEGLTHQRPLSIHRATRVPRWATYSNGARQLKPGLVAATERHAALCKPWTVDRPANSSATLELHVVTCHRTRRLRTLLVVLGQGERRVQSDWRRMAGHLTV